VLKRQRNCSGNSIREADDDGTRRDWGHATVASWTHQSNDGSISMQKRFSKPFTLVGSLLNFCPNASLPQQIITST
jgi:hypothetical protein